MSKTFAYVGLVMGTIFMGFGILIAIRPPDVDMIRDNNYLVAFIVIMYGAFRIYRSVVMLRESKDDIENRQ